jgi:hypothetical protein
LGNYIVYVPPALERRNRFLSLFAPADEARVTLSHANWAELDRATTLQMVTTLYGAFGSKTKREMVKAVIDMFESDEIVRVTARFLNADDDPMPQWQPMLASPAALALACRMLIATHKFEPKPAELRAAVCDARNRLRGACSAAEFFCNRFLEWDAILLQHAHDEWERPYLTEQYRPLLKRVLDLHETTLIFGGEDCDGDWDEANPTPFELLIRAEQDKLALPAPEQTNTAVAACVQPPAKKTHKPKRGKPKGTSVTVPTARDQALVRAVGLAIAQHAGRSPEPRDYELAARLLCRPGAPLARLRPDQLAPAMNGTGISIDALIG